jgi:Na+-driven multidrug efflux pump
MRLVAIIFTILVGAFFILARDFSARFMLSFDYHRPAVRKREKTFLRWYAVASVCFGVVCIVLGALMAMNIVFPS